MSDKVAPIGVEVHVLEYVHGRGEDITVHASWDGAVHQKAEYARMGWAGLRTQYPELPANPPEDDAEAAAMYFDRETNESAHITTSTVQA